MCFCAIKYFYILCILYQFCVQLNANSSGYYGMIRNKRSTIGSQQDQAGGFLGSPLTASYGFNSLSPYGSIFSRNFPAPYALPYTLPAPQQFPFGNYGGGPLPFSPYPGPFPSPFPPAGFPGYPVPGTVYPVPAPAVPTPFYPPPSLGNGYVDSNSTSTPTPIVISDKTAAIIGIATLINSLITKNFFPVYPDSGTVPLPIPVKVPVPIPIDRPVPVGVVKSVHYHDSGPDEIIHDIEGDIGFNPHEPPNIHDKSFKREVQFNRNRGIVKRTPNIPNRKPEVAFKPSNWHRFNHQDVKNTPKLQKTAYNHEKMHMSRVPNTNNMQMMSINRENPYIHEIQNNMLAGGRELSNIYAGMLNQNAFNMRGIPLIRQATIGGESSIQNGGIMDVQFNRENANITERPPRIQDDLNSTTNLMNMSEETLPQEKPNTSEVAETLNINDVIDIIETASKGEDIAIFEIHEATSAANIPNEVLIRPDN